MFLHLSASHSVHARGCLPLGLGGVPLGPGEGCLSLDRKEYQSSPDTTYSKCNNDIIKITESQAIYHNQPPVAEITYVNIQL